METKSEPIGWLLVDDKPQVLIRDASGHVAAQTESESAFERFAIQTGRFRRGDPLHDWVVLEAAGFSNP